MIAFFQLLFFKDVLTNSRNVKEKKIIEALKRDDVRLLEIIVEIAALNCDIQIFDYCIAVTLINDYNISERNTILKERCKMGEKSSRPVDMSTLSEDELNAAAVL